MSLAIVTAKQSEITSARERLKDFRNLSVEELLNLLCAFGEPRISKHNTGWVSTVEMHVAAAGAKFEIRSGFDHQTALAAIQQVSERVLKVLAQWS